MAFWQNGKLYLHGSTQSVARTVDPLASWVGIDPNDLVLVGEYAGGGFGSKGAGAVSMSIPALLSKKANAPVMMRISREEEHYIGRARTGMVGRAKVGFAKDGRITAIDLFIIEDNGAYGPMGDFRSAATATSLIWQPKAMRWRGAAVLTNTPPRSQQRSPGPMQGNGIMEPIVTKAAKQLGLDQAAIRRINSPEGKASYGPPAGATRRYITSSYVKESIDRGIELFNWNERKTRAGQRNGSKVRGLGVAVGPHGAGSIGYDGLMTIQPDGKLYVQSGVGNLGTHSCIDLATSRGRRAVGAVGPGPGELGQHGEAHSVELHVGRQPDDACDDAGEHGGCGGRGQKAEGDRRARSRRSTGRLHARRTREWSAREIPRAASPTRRPPAAPSSLAERSTDMTCRTTSTR